MVPTCLTPLSFAFVSSGLGRESIIQWVLFHTVLGISSKPFLPNSSLTLLLPTDVLFCKSLRQACLSSPRNTPAFSPTTKLASISQGHRGTTLEPPGPTSLVWPLSPPAPAPASTSTLGPVVHYLQASHRKRRQENRAPSRTSRGQTFSQCLPLLSPDDLPGPFHL